MKTVNLIILLIALVNFAVLAQDADSSKRDISLKVITKKGRPVRSVLVQSINAGTAGITDRKGLFVFEDISDNDIIGVILPKYGKAMIPVTGMDSIVVILRSARNYSYIDNNGQSVFVNKEKTESSTLIDVPTLLKQGSYRTLADLLQGRVAGLRIQGTDEYASANIRGTNSLSSSTVSSEPLVVLDGVPVGTLNEANRIVNVYTIQTIEVLKNATEWGVRGANGVIVIKSIR